MHPGLQEGLLNHQGAMSPMRFFTDAFNQVKKFSL